MDGLLGPRVRGQWISPFLQIKKRKGGGIGAGLGVGQSSFLVALTFGSLPILPGLPVDALGQRRDGVSIIIGVHKNVA